MTLNRNTYQRMLYIDGLAKIVLTRGSQEPEPVFPIGAVVQYLLI